MNSKFMVSDGDGALYDTSRKGWAELPPLRPVYEFTI